MTMLDLHYSTSWVMLNRFNNNNNNNNNNTNNNININNRNNSNHKRLCYAPYLVTLQVCAQDTVFFQKGGFKSCAEIHQEFPQTESGYYWVTIGNRQAQVYCDMKNYGEYMLSY